MQLKVLLKSLPHKIFHLKRSMALFTQVLNPITGVNEWEAHSEDYDYHQEVANAGFGDMLHDKERNQKYFAALRKTIYKMHADGKEAHVLDIGTGTGILSMMAVSAGADSVTACEAFLPMANCAERILKANKMENKIKLVKKRSTDLKVGTDLSQRANLLVTEVLDTELIGEGAIGIYNHAHSELLTEDVVCIPALATCYAQVVESPLAAQWNTLKILANLDGDILLKPTPDIKECKGEAALHDVQLSQLSLDKFRPLTAATPIFEFDFNRKKEREVVRNRNISLQSTSAGSTDLVFYWWDIKMDLEGEIILSCAPFWAHPEFADLRIQHSAERQHSNIVPWRDHWMQAIYYIPKPLQLAGPQKEFVLSCYHDEYSLWFDAFTNSAEIKANSVPRHSCTCTLHMTYSRSRIGQMNQASRNKRFLRHLQETIGKDAKVLVLGDGCLLGLSTAKLGAASVICHEPHRFSRHLMSSLARHNELNNVRFIEKLDEISAGSLSELTHIFAEPYFLTSILPWDNFYFGTLVQQLISKEKLNMDKVQITPHSARIFAVPVEFLDLHKIRTPLRNCEGFDMALFDEMVDISKSIAQAKIEAQPLWEYPCKALAAPQELIHVAFTDFKSKKTMPGTFNIEHSGSCNGIALWVDWQLDDNPASKTVVSTGPTQPIEVGGFIQWDMFVRQGVHLIGDAKQVVPSQSTINWCVEFTPTLGELKFHFHVNA